MVVALGALQSRTEKQPGRRFTARGWISVRSIEIRRWLLEHATDSRDQVSERTDQADDLRRCCLESSHERLDPFDVETFSVRSTSAHLRAQNRRTHRESTVDRSIPLASGVARPQRTPWPPRARQTSNCVQIGSPDKVESSDSGEGLMSQSLEFGEHVFVDFVVRGGITPLKVGAGFGERDRNRDLLLQVAHRSASLPRTWPATRCRLRRHWRSNSMTHNTLGPLHLEWFHPRSGLERGVGDDQPVQRRSPALSGRPQAVRPRRAALRRPLGSAV